MVAMINGNEKGMADICESPSAQFKGPCLYDRDCRIICSTEGFPDGHCKGSCICRASPCKTTLVSSSAISSILISSFTFSDHKVQDFNLFRQRLFYYRIYIICTFMLIRKKHSLKRFSIFKIIPRPFIAKKATPKFRTHAFTTQETRQCPCVKKSLDGLPEHLKPRPCIYNEKSMQSLGGYRTRSRTSFIFWPLGGLPNDFGLLNGLDSIDMKLRSDFCRSLNGGSCMRASAGGFEDFAFCLLYLGPPKPVEISISFNESFGFCMCNYNRCRLRRQYGQGEMEDTNGEIKWENKA
ncbi:defensin [Striga asiatica]|uniref:Defensin n=1 Tax=Striga asiatica TaxID=4170 RepID=A0A5A7R675_STRAF|nr:defensin [Striga asiatica]